jgi:hypothetical protein
MQQIAGQRRVPSGPFCFVDVLESDTVIAQKKGKRLTAIVVFALMLLIWYATVSHDTLGFVPLNGPQALGFDLWTGFIWCAFFYSAWWLWRVFRKGKADTSGIN